MCSSTPQARWATRCVDNDIASLGIQQKWPARFPDRIQLYSLPTPNGVKVSIMLEECALPYEPHRVSAQRRGAGLSAGSSHTRRWEKSVTIRKWRRMEMPTFRSEALG